MRTSPAPNSAHEFIGSTSGQWNPPAFLDAIWYAFVFSLAFTDLVFLPNVFRDSLQLSTLLLAALVVSLVGWAWRSNSHFSRPDKTSALLYAFFFLAALSVLESFWSPLQEYRGERLWDKGVRQVLALAICVATYWVTVAMVRSRRHVMRTLAVYVSTLIPSGIAAALDLLNYYAPSGTVTFLDSAIHRNVLIAPAAVFGIVVPRMQLLAFEPSMAANYLLSVVPAAFAIAMVGGHTELLTRARSRALGVLGAVMLVGTFSLGGLVGAWSELGTFVALGRFVLSWKQLLQVATVAGIGLAIVSSIPTRTGPPLSAAASAPPATASAPPATASAPPATASAPPATASAPAAQNRLAALVDSGAGDPEVSLSWRQITLATAWNTFRDHPLVGVGWGNSTFYVLQEFPEYGWRHPYAAVWTAADGGSASTVSSNNMMARVLAETGLIGGLLFVLWHLGVARRGVLTLIKGDPLALGLLVAEAGLVVGYAGLSGLDKRYWFFLPAMIVVVSRFGANRSTTVARPITGEGSPAVGLGH